MEQLKKKALNVEIHYAAAQFMYWAAAVCLQGFTAVFLSHRGLTDGQIGATVSCTSVTSILLQLFISNFCDNHPEIPLKKIISALCLISLVFVGIMKAAALPVLVLAVFFLIADTPQKANSGLMNALLIQYSNAGVPVRFGWPRGVGSLGWALCAYIFGFIMEKRSPDILLTLFLCLEIFALGTILSMPGGVASENKHPSGKGASSYGEMIRSNRALRFFLASLIIMGMGQASIGTFLNRIVESLGGGSSQLGTCIMIQSGLELPVMFISGLLLKKFSSGQLVLFSFGCYCLKAVAMACCTSLSFFYVIMCSGLVCYGIYGFAGVLYANDIVGSDQKVRAQSLASLCFTGGIGGVIGNAIGGVLMEKYGLPVIYVYSSLLSAAAAFLMLLSIRCLKKQKEQLS